MSTQTEMGVLKVDIAVFQNNWPMAQGWYWSLEEHQLLRGPFKTKEEAIADAHQISEDLVRIILDAREAAARRPQ